MQFKTYNIKRFLFATILLLFIVLFLQQKLKLKFEWPLSGAVTYTEKPAFTFKSWFDDSFQPQFEKYINEQFGFRNYFVRLNNQIAFNLFNKAKANGVVIGKKNYLYEINYIKAYYGLDSISDSLIDSRLQKVKYVQDTLKKLNIDLILIYAPGKAAYLPEFIPDDKKPAQTFRTNYSYYIKESNKLDLNYIDYHDYFSKLKSTTKYPLYPQYGIHWSSHGRDIVLDSIVHYIEHLRKIDLNNIVFKDLTVSDSLRESDYDIGNGMNLLFKLKSIPMAYSNFSVESNNLKTKPRMLAIADSYWWSIFGIGVSQTLFNNSKFWFYNNEVYPDNSIKATKVEQLDFKKEVESNDIIIIMATDANLPNFGWGFIETAYELYTKGLPIDRMKDPAYFEKVKNLMNYIRTQKEWFNGVIEQAKNKGISVDSMLEINAMFAISEGERKNNK